MDPFARIQQEQNKSLDELGASFSEKLENFSQFASEKFNTALDEISQEHQREMRSMERWNVILISLLAASVILNFGLLMTKFFP